MTLGTTLDEVTRLHGLSFAIKGRAVHGQSDDGAWFATDGDGREVVLKVFPDGGAALRFEVLMGALDVLRERGYPVPQYGPVLVVPGATVVVQGVMAGSTTHNVSGRLVQQLIELNELQLDVPSPVNPLPWGAFIVHSLVEGERGWAMHLPLHDHSSRARRMLDRIERIGATTESHRLRPSGIVHLDLHQGNLLLHPDDGLAGVVDWEGACDGDPRFDLVTLAHNLTATGNRVLATPLWSLLEAVIDPHVLRAYVAHMVLRLVDWQIRHDPSDVANQLQVGEELLDRYDR